MGIQITAFWDVTTYSLVHRDRCFQGTCCLHLLPWRHMQVLPTRYQSTTHSVTSLMMICQGCIYALAGYNEGLQARQPGFDSRQGQEIFIFSTVSRPTLGSTQPPIRKVLGSLFRGGGSGWCVSWPLPPSSAKVKNGGTIPLLPHIYSWQCLIN
jgi:hypothetical protein